MFFQKRRCMLALALIIGGTAQHAMASCEYTITSDWGSGFNAQIVISNTSSTAVSSWEVSWQQTGATSVSSAWNGTLSGANPYTVTNLSWNGNLAVGQSVSIGLGGSGPGQVVPVYGDLCESGTSSSSSSSTSSTSSSSTSSSSTSSSNSTSSTSSSSTSSSSSGGSCPAYVNGLSYNVGDIVSNVGNAYSCVVAGWCSSTLEAYEPGVGWAWSDAWQLAPAGSCGSSSSTSSTSSTGGISSSTSSSGGSLPSGWDSVDIGTTNVGSTSYSNNSFTIEASGYDIWWTNDNFRFTYHPLVGDGQITANIESVTEANTWTKIGLMLRSDLSVDSKNAFMLMRPSEGSAFQSRKTVGAATNSSWRDAPSQSDWRLPEFRARYLMPSEWLKLVRTGDTITAYSSDDGLCWNERWTDTVELGNSIYAGIGLAANTMDNYATAVVSDVEVSNTIPADINAQCARAQTDKFVPTPTQWIVEPNISGNGDSWYFTTTSPEASTMPVPCFAGDMTRWRWFDSDTTCPAETNNQAWANSGFTYDGTWQLAQGGFGPMNSESFVATNVVAQEIWLRKEVTLTQQQIDNLMFFGRWDNNVVIYVNGVLATYTTSGEAYSHLGMNDAARAALQPGVNVIAARVYEPDPRNQGKKAKVDFGLTTLPTLVNLPRTAYITGSPYASMAEAVYQLTQEQGAIGAVYAAHDNGSLIEKHSFGWRDVDMTEPMPENAVLRLASNDKAVTKAAIVKVLNETSWGPHDKVFGPTGVLSHITPMPGWSVGANMNDITIEHLRTWEDGITGFGDKLPHQDFMALQFGIDNADLTKEHLARAMYSTNTAWVPGAKSQYSSHGHFLLRYIVEVITGKSFKDYLQQDMGASSEMVVAHERLAYRHPNEADYRFLVDETHARWAALEEYLAVGSSASAMVDFFGTYAADFTLNGETYTPINGGGGGSMAGTRAGLGVDYNNKIAQSMIWNSDYLGAGDRLDDIRRMIDGETTGSCVPSDNLSTAYRIRSVSDTDAYIHMEGYVLQASEAESYWWSAQWVFEEVIDGGNTYYRIRNRWSNQYVHLQTSNLEVGSISSTWQSAQWILENQGSYYNIRNRQYPDRYINIDSGSLAATNTSSAANWYICY